MIGTRSKCVSQIKEGMHLPSIICTTNSHYWFSTYSVLHIMLCPQIIISEYNKTYHTPPSCYYILDLLCVTAFFCKLKHHYFNPKTLIVSVVGLYNFETAKIYWKLPNRKWAQKIDILHFAVYIVLLRMNWNKPRKCGNT